MALLREQSASQAVGAARVLPPLRILVVDDNAVNQQVVGGLLVRAGHSVATADCGPAAIAAISDAGTRPFDVVLMDVQMPEMDGLTATRHVRALPPPLSGVAVIALTARASNSSREECIDAGMNGFVSKPVRLRTLLDEIAAVLEMPAEKTGAAPISRSSDDLLDAEQVAELVTSLDPEAWDRLITSFAAAAEAEIDHIIDAIGSVRVRRAPRTRSRAWPGTPGRCCSAISPSNWKPQLQPKRSALPRNFARFWNAASPH